MQGPKQLITKALVWLCLVSMVHICMQFYKNWNSESWDKHPLALGQLDLWKRIREDFHLLCQAVQWWCKSNSCWSCCHLIQWPWHCFFFGFLLNALPKTSMIKFSDITPILNSIKRAKIVSWQGHCCWVYKELKSVFSYKGLFFVKREPYSYCPKLIYLYNLVP